MLRCFLAVSAIALLSTDFCAAPIHAAEPLTLTTPEQENKLGEEAFRDILKKEQLCQNRELVVYVERVAKRVAAAAPDKGFKYEIAVIESEQVNAFCLPGGKMAVYTGILPYCQNEAGLATVLGHEVAHAILRHGGQRMTQSTVVDAVGTGLAELLRARGASAAASTLTMGVYDAGTKLGILLPYSRSHETEADTEGLMYMARAGYDPREAPEFWKRFSALKSNTPTFLSTHPAHADRAGRLEKLQAEAQKLYAQSPKLGLGDNLPPLKVGAQALTQSAPAQGLAPAQAGSPATLPAGGWTLASLAETEIRKGLQEALSTGMKNAIAKLGKEDGYFKDELVKIVMPEKLKELEKVVRMLGKGKQADEFVQQMNRAAEKAAPATADVLAAAIAQLTLEDARGIAKGQKDEATQYFKKSADTALIEKILPLVKDATASAGATKAYKDLIKKAGFAGRALAGNFDLDEYVTRKAVDGLYVKMAEEEQRIRANPAGQTSDILRKVFGARKE